MHVSAVAFDFGGVLAQPPFAGLEAHARRLGLPRDAFNRYFRGDPEMARLEVGAITSRDFFKYVCIAVEEAHGTRIDIRDLAAAAAQGERLRPEMIDLVAEVHGRCTTALLTNNVREAGWRDAFPCQHFDVVVDSSDLGVRKPDVAAYQALIARLDRPATEIAFIDDFFENLGPAAELGMTVIEFSDPASCRAALADLGVLPVVAR